MQNSTSYSPSLPFESRKTHTARRRHVEEYLKVRGVHRTTTPHRTAPAAVGSDEKREYREAFSARVAEDHHARVGPERPQAELCQGLLPLLEGTAVGPTTDDQRFKKKKIETREEIFDRSRSSRCFSGWGKTKACRETSRSGREERQRERWRRKAQKHAVQTHTNTNTNSSDESQFDGSTAVLPNARFARNMYACHPTRARTHGLARSLQQQQHYAFLRDTAASPIPCPASCARTRTRTRHGFLLTRAAACARQGVVGHDTFYLLRRCDNRRMHWQTNKQTNKPAKEKKDTSKRGPNRSRRGRGALAHHQPLAAEVLLHLHRQPQADGAQDVRRPPLLTLLLVAGQTTSPRVRSWLFRSRCTSYGAGCCRRDRKSTDGASCPLLA